jgi:hypothetical protein
VHALDRVRAVDDPADLGDLEIDTASRFDTAGDQTRDFFEPCADVRLDRGGFLVREHLVSSFLNCFNAADGVDHRVALDEVASVQLRQICGKGAGDEIVECLDDPVGLPLR